MTVFETWFPPGPVGQGPQEVIVEPDDGDELVTDEVVVDHIIQVPLLDPGVVLEREVV